MKKKFIVLLIFSLLVVSGCSNDTTNSSKTDSEKATEQVTEGNKPKFAELMIEKVDDSSFYVVATAEGQDLSYAYYVYKDDQVVEKFKYTKDAHFSYKVNKPGTYKVKVYIKDKNDTVVSQFTNEVNID